MKTYADEAGAGISDDGGNIKFAKGGWYTLCFKAKINGEAIDYTLTVYPAALYIIGNATGGWDEASPALQLTLLPMVVAFGCLRHL